MNEGPVISRAKCGTRLGAFPVAGAFVTKQSGLFCHIWEVCASCRTCAETKHDECTRYNVMSLACLRTATYYTFIVLCLYAYNVPVTEKSRISSGGIDSVTHFPLSLLKPELHSCGSEGIKNFKVQKKYHYRNYYITWWERMIFWGWLDR